MQQEFQLDLMASTERIAEEIRKIREWLEKVDNKENLNESIINRPITNILPS